MADIPYLFHPAGGPGSPLDGHFDGGQTPVLSVVVAVPDKASAGLCLLLIQHGQDAENDGDAGVEPDSIVNTWPVERLLAWTASHNS